jgi:hypothetical protein
MSQIEVKDGTPFSNLAKAGTASELGNLIQIATSAINIIARDPDVRAARTLAPILTGAASALQRAGVIVKVAIPGAERASAEVRSEPAGCRGCAFRDRPCPSRNRMLTPAHVGVMQISHDRRRPD